MQFPYWDAPEEQIDLLSKNVEVCSLCGQKGQCFELEYIYPEHSEKEGKKGCLDCLKTGRFTFSHDTEIGLLNKDGLRKEYKHNLEPAWTKHLPELYLENLRRTPFFISYQQGLWLTHCQDFMIFIGTWGTIDFHLNSENGDGRALFIEMTDPSMQEIWPFMAKESGLPLSKRSIWYHAFKCPHCQRLRGYWDCD